MPVRNKGFDDASKRWADARNIFNEEARKMAKEMSAELARITKRNTPVDTGNLRRMWTIGPIENNGRSIEVSVFNATDYVFHVEYGHRLIRGGRYVGYVPGRFFVRRSNEQFRPAFKIMSKDLQKRINERLGGDKK